MIWEGIYMIMKKENNRECFVCHVKSHNPKVDMPMIIFNYLDGYLAICEKCLFEKLTGSTTATWHKDMINKKTGKLFWE